MNDWVLYLALGVLGVGLLVNAAMTLALSKPIREILDSRRPEGLKPGTKIPMEKLTPLEGSLPYPFSGDYSLVVLSAHCSACAALMEELVTAVQSTPEISRSSSVALLWVSSPVDVPQDNLETLAQLMPVVLETGYPPLTEQIGLHYSPAILKIDSGHSILEDETASISKVLELCKSSETCENGRG